MSDNKFVTGLFVNAPHEKAPEFVKASLSFKPAEFVEWLNQQEPNDKGYVRIQVKVSGKSGKWYAELDNWKPDPSKQHVNQRDKIAKAKPSDKEFQDNDLRDIPF
jgi:hypothetical protein